MVSAERIQITLKGGAPWGFRLSGGGSLPLAINKIRKRSAAHSSGLREGDSVISINGVPVHDKSQDDALELVEQAADTLTLEIFRGDMDELTRAKPKKAIMIGGGGGANVGQGAEGGEEIILTTSIQETHSQAPVIGIGSNFLMTASTETSSEMAQASNVDTDGNLTDSTIVLSTGIDDVTSSSIMVDSMSAEVGDIVSSGIDLQLASESCPTAAQPFTDSSVIAVTPSHLSPQPPRVSPKPVAFSPQQKAVSPKSPVAFPTSSSSPSLIDKSPKSPAFNVVNLRSPSNATSPKSPSFTATSPKSPSFQATSPQPVSTSPRPGVMQPIVQNASPKPFHSSNVSTSTVTSTETFNDGQGRIRKVTKVTSTQNDKVDGFTQSKQIQTPSNQGKSFTAHQSSAFEVPNPRDNRLPADQNPQQSVPLINRNGPTPFSTTVTQTSLTVNTFSAPAVSPGIGRKWAPKFKPSKYVLGQNSKKDTPVRKDLPLNYPKNSPQPNVAPRKPVIDEGKENIMPLFQVKNIVGKKRRDVWKPNVWLPDQQQGQKSQQHQLQQPSMTLKDDFSPYTTFPVPHVPHGISLAEQKTSKEPRYGVQSTRYVDQEEDYDEVDDNEMAIRPNRLHIFAPPVEIHALDDSGYPESPYSPFLPYTNQGEINVGYGHEEGPSSPDSSAIRKKKLYSDSAFYDTPGKSYPTITEQMKLCKIIATSLTSQANRRARGAKMFMKRKRKSNKWVHDGKSDWSSSAGDVANLHDLDSELSIEEGGTKPLFYFKIPNLKNRISSADRKMALTQEQFERLRLQANKCDHKVVPPNKCFDIVSDLRTSKGRGGRMFEKQKNRAEKYVIDDKKAKHGKYSRLENVLNQPTRQEKTPWEAAAQHGGNVDAAFSHIDEMERNQKLNQILKYPQPKKYPDLPPPKSDPLVKASLRSNSDIPLLRGKDFNRTARGWNGGGEYPVADQLSSIQAPSQKVLQMSSSQSFGDYNPKIKAWESSGSSPYVKTASPNVHVHQQHPVRQDQGWGQQSWHAGLNQQRSLAQMDERWRSQDDFYMKPQSQNWGTDGDYAATQYKDEYDYTYVPVDYRFSDEYEFGSPAYKQPIIPGTDL